MELSFSKYHGAGNDFILINNFNQQISLSRDQIAQICNRHLGIGADGLICLLPSPIWDFAMNYYNSDGLEGSMCGNGGRCIVAFAHNLGIVGKNCAFAAIDGKHTGQINDKNDNVYTVKVSLQNVNEITKNRDYYLVNTGSPHYVKFVNDLSTIDVFLSGKRIRWQKKFQPEGINVNFVERSKDKLIVHTFERGVENITLSCGTGVTASAIACSLEEGSVRPYYDISTEGGDLLVRFEKAGNQFINIELEGNATHVFDAKICI